jgi:ATP-dependent helicase/DNAse subunit B
VPADYVFSPSALEAYAACPQRFFMSRVLRVRRVEEPERTVRINALHRGSLIHRILERFHAEWEGSGPAALAAEAPARMRAIAGEECDAAQARGETGYPAMWAADRLEVVEDCLRWLEVERGDPRTAALPRGACEARFGRRRPGEATGALSQDEPLSIPLDGRAMRLSGRIDRIVWDERRTRFRVVDYKSGRVRDEKSGRLLGGRMLQLPLYFHAGASLLGIDAAGGEAAYVYPTRRGEFRTVDWTGAQLVERHDDLTAMLAAVVDGIGRGDFMVAPWDPGRGCTFCEFDAVCPRGREGYVERRREDDRLRPFVDGVRSVQ